MGWLSWLFGTRKAEAVDTSFTRTDAWLARMESTGQTLVATNTQTTSEARSARKPTDGEFWMDYTSEGGESRRRRVIFLSASPPNLIQAIDLDRNRVRSYRLDRISGITNANADRMTVAEFLADSPPFRRGDLTPTTDTEKMALRIRKELLCQLSIILTLAKADGPIDSITLDLIMAYAARETRFAVIEGWVPKGEKASAWPILRDMVIRMDPSPDHLEAYIRTVNEEWSNPRRFKALNDALSEMVNRNGAPSGEALRLARQIERYANR